jgi:hypothetical protein
VHRAAILLITFDYEGIDLSPKIVTNSDEPPEIDVLAESVSWTDIETYVRFSKRFLLVEVPGSGGQYKGFFYLGGNGLEQTPELGTDLAAAIKAFREHLRQPV